jgi:hypothetical protein
MSGIWQGRQGRAMVGSLFVQSRVALCIMILMLIGSLTVKADGTAPVAPFQTCASAPNPACLLQEAMRGMDMIESEGKRAFVLEIAVPALANANDPDTAVLLLIHYWSGYGGHFDMSSIARAYARLGRDSDAMAVVNSTSVEDVRQVLLAAVVQGQVEAGRISDATVTAALITVPAEKARALAALGQSADAITMAETLPSPELEFVLMDISVWLARQGQISQAIDAHLRSNKYDDFGNEIRPRDEIAYALVRADRVAEVFTEGPPLFRPDLSLLLSIWRVKQDPLIAEELRKRLGNGSPDSYDNTQELWALAVLNPNAGYDQAASALLSALAHDQFRTILIYLDIEMLSNSGQFAQAAQVILETGQGDYTDNAWGVTGLFKIAAAMTADTLNPLNL